MMLERAHHRIRHIDVPVLTLVLETAVALPYLDNDIQRLARHVAILALHAIHAEQLPIARQSTRADAEHVAALRQMIHKGDTAGEFRGMMIRQQVRARRELDALRLHQRLSDQQVGRGIRLPWRSEVLANPGLAIAEAVS